MKEIGAKILVIDQEKCEKTLRKLGAKKTLEGEVRTTYNIFSNKSIKRAKNLLRLRKVGEKIFLTCKKYVQNKNVNIRKEYEIGVSVHKTTDIILKFLKVSLLQTVKKIRTSCILNNAHLEFDTHLEKFAFIPLFFEIEAQKLTVPYTSDQLFGFMKNDCKPWSFFDVVAYHKKTTIKKLIFKQLYQENIY
jgi:predicted adenylyl cyclase CyaB